MRITRYLAVLFVATLAFAACDEHAAPPTALARVSDGEPVLLVQERMLEDVFADAEVHTEPGEPPMGHTFDSYSVEGSGDTYYAIARGKTAEGSCFITAKRLVVEDDRIGPFGADGRAQMIPGGNSCTGMDGCQGCEFTYSGNTIDGCNCTKQAPSGGWCSHTVTD